MVVLSKLSTDFYKYLGFKNRTVGINFTKYVHQVTANNIKGYLKQFLKRTVLELF